MRSFHKPKWHFYKSLRLKTKLTITHLVIVVIPMIVLGIFFFTKFYGMIVSDTIRSEQIAAAQTAPLIEETVREILTAHQTLTESTLFRSLTNDPNDQLVTLDHSVNVEIFRELVDELKKGQVITDIKIYLDLTLYEKILGAAPVSPVFLPLNQALGTYWHGIFTGEPGRTSLFCPPFYLSPSEIEHYGDSAYISKNYIYRDGSRIPFFTAVYFSQEHLDNILRANSSGNNVTYIINQRNSIVASSDYALSGTYRFSYETVQESLMTTGNYITKQYLGEEVYAGFYKIRDTDWFMITVMPSPPLIQKGIGSIAIFTLVYVFFIIMAMVIATFLSNSISNRLSSIINQMAKARIGPPVPLPDSDTQDEIGDLIDSYNYMTRVINELMEQQAKASEDLRISEFNSLQAQINPHFLYNTMDMINWLSQQGRPHEVTDAIQKLSRFYKLTLSRKQSLSTVKDEIEHASIYLHLQNMRFHNMIDFFVDIPDELLDNSIPKLTLQPIVENSILHGILEKEEKQGTIVLTGWKEEANHRIVLMLSDDGVGISEDTLKNLLSDTGKLINSSGTRIAVYNTHRRIQLLFGTDYGLSYSHATGGGTEVTIYLPISF